MVTQVRARCHQTSHCVLLVQVSGAVAICITSGLTCPCVEQPAASTQSTAMRLLFITGPPPFFSRAQGAALYRIGPKRFSHGSYLELGTRAGTGLGLSAIFGPRQEARAIKKAAQGCPSYCRNDARKH
ncbi:hypothetical protein PCAR4_150105 [Paraburkholderia caribensis]|nr:hypothetical protein PCAR4_150105 [Paraburkholderia caribensis]